MPANRCVNVVRTVPKDVQGDPLRVDAAGNLATKGSMVRKVVPAETVDLARAWMATQTGPMLLLVHLMEPHLDYAPPLATRGTFTGDGPPLVPIPFGSAGQIELKDDRGIPTPPVVWVVGVVDVTYQL